MVLRISTDRALRTPDALAALVDAIVQADPTNDQETHWLEWKGPLPIDKAEGQFAIAKAILGFANREPAHAAPMCEGTAYMVIGAEPGSARGITPIDHAKLAHGIRKYANGPQWSAHHVSHDGATVLVIVAEAPKPGDPIHTLAKQYNNFNEGTVFHRGAAQTEPAGAREIAMLSKRLMRGTQQPDLDLELDIELTPMIRQRLDDPEWFADHQAYLDSRRTPPRRRSSTAPPGSPGMPDLPASFAGLSEFWADPGGIAEFNRRLVEYNSDLADRLRENIVRQIVRSDKNKVWFVAENRTHDPIEGVQLLVTMPLEVLAFAGSPQTRRLRPLPKWPDPLDSMFKDKMTALVEDFEHADLLSRWDGSVHYRDDTIEVTFDVGDLRPGQHYETPPITLFVEPDAPAVLPVTVTARAMNRRRDRTTMIEMPIDGEMVGIGVWYGTTAANES
jgi:hypothetical protein